MARPRTFEIDDALDAAIEAFWERGYEATSMADLMAAMGLQKGSIYKVWADKRTLFLAALGRYLDRGLEGLCGLAASDPDPEKALAALLGHFTGTCERTKRGCLALNTVVELGPHDDETAALLATHHQRVIGVFAELVRRGQEAGRFRADVPAEELAGFLFVVVTGMLTRSKGAAFAGEARRTAELALAALH